MSSITFSSLAPSCFLALCPPALLPPWEFISVGQWWVVLLAGIGTWFVFNFAAVFSVALVREQCPTTLAILSGDFDDSQIGQMLAKWFKSRPQREEQRQLFVNILLAVGCPPARLAERTLRCVTGVRWEENRTLENCWHAKPRRLSYSTRHIPPNRRHSNGGEKKPLRELPIGCGCSTQTGP